MRNRQRYKWLIAALVPLVGIGIYKGQKLEGISAQEATVEATASPFATQPKIAGVEEVMAENAVANSDNGLRGTQPGAPWDIKTFTPLLSAPFFINLSTLKEPIDHKYSFYLSRSEKTRFVGVDPAPNIGEGKYVNATKLNPGDSFRVTDVGFYEGEALDLMVKVVDHYVKEREGISVIYIMFDELYFTGINGQSIGGNDYLDLEYTTVVSGTDTPVSTYGVLPYQNGLPNTQISLSANQIGKVYGVSDNVMQYKEEASLGRFSFATDEPSGRLPGTSNPPQYYPIGPLDPQRDVTVVYDDVATRTFRYQNNFEPFIASGFAMRERSPVPLKLPQPDVIGNKYSENQAMQYDVRQFIPLEPETHLFKDFFIDLPLENAFKPIDVDQISVSNNMGYTLTKQEFAVHVDNASGKQKVSVEILPVYRAKNKGRDFYGKYLTVNMPVAVDYTKDLSAFIDGKLVRVPLKATTRVDTDFYKSITSDQGFAEATNEGKMTVNHFDDKNRNIIDEVIFEEAMGTKWAEDYTENGGYELVEMTQDGKVVSSGTINGFDNQLVVTFKDKRYTTKFSASATDDNTGETAREEDVMSYKLNVTSKVKPSYLTPEDNHYQTAKVTLEDYATDLLEMPSEGKLLLADDTVVGSATFNPATKSYDITLTDDTVSWETDVCLAFDAQVKKGAIPGKVVKMTPTVELTFDKKGLSYSGQAKTLETEIVKAKLEIVSHPNAVDFGVIKRTTFGGEKIYPIKSMGDDLVIRDERSIGEGWKVTAKLTSDFKTIVGGNEHKLTDILKYKEGNSVKDLPLNTKVMIHNEMTSSDPTFNISKDWVSKKEGLVLQLFAGNAKDSDYSATVEWELEDAY